MGVYLSALVISLGLSRLAGKSKIIIRGKRKYFEMGIILAFIPFWIISCFRYNVGTDFVTYVGFYSENIPKGLYKSDFLFSLLIKLCVNVFHNEYLIIWILATIFLSLTAVSIYKYSENIQFSILLFFLTGTFSLSLNIMKQMVATAIWLYSIDFIRKKRLFIYLCLLTIAIGFHKVAIIYAVTYFLYSKQIPIKKSFPLILGLLYIFSTEIRYIIIAITRRLNFYYGYFYNIHDQRTGSLTLLVINLSCLCLLMYVLDRNRDEGKRKKLYFYYNVQFICAAFTVLMPIIPNSDRIVYLFVPLQIISVPNALCMINRKRKRVIIGACATALYFGLFLKLFIIGNMGETLPYTWLKVF